MAVQIAKAVGARIVAVVSGTAKAKMLLDIGADAVVDHHEAKWEDKVRAHTANGEGVDVVYDSIGAIESGIRCLKYRGRLVIVGFAARGGKMEEVRANRILLKGITVVGYVSCFFIFFGCQIGLLMVLRYKEVRRRCSPQPAKVAGCLGGLYETRRGGED